MSTAKFEYCFWMLLYFKITQVTEYLPRVQRCVTSMIRGNGQATHFLFVENGQLEFMISRCCVNENYILV